MKTTENKDLYFRYWGKAMSQLEIDYRSNMMTSDAICKKHNVFQDALEKKARNNEWRKINEDEKLATYHLLVYHCLDVAAVAAIWWEESGVIRNLFSSIFPDLDTEKIKAWLLFFIVLHDFGKLDARFQLKAVQIVKLCWPELLDADVDPSIGYDHGIEGFLWFCREYKTLLDIEDESLEIWDVWPDWMAAVAGHHGEIYSRSGVQQEEYADENIMEQDSQARLEWIKEAEEMFLYPANLSLKSMPPTCGREQQIALAGFCSICDWLGSSEKYFEFEDKQVCPKEYFDEKKMHIRENGLLDQSGLISRPTHYPGVQATIPEGKTARGVQTIVDDVPIEAGLLIIEAPTGSGKTEAALAYAWHLLELGNADSIVFALPTQATANAMLERVKKFASKLFPNGGANVVLAHGKRDYNPEFINLKKAANGRTAQGKEEASAQCAQWLAQSRKRVFLGQIGVCTIDQVLLSVLPIRHKFVRGFGLNKSVLIVDEVHAYDCYMYGLLGEVLTRQKLSGGSAVLLSATLPQKQRSELVESWQIKDASQDNDYPLLTHAVSNVVKLYKVAKEHKPEPTDVQIELTKLNKALPNNELYDKMIEAAESGARVAMICNLVDDAQLVAETLQNKITQKKTTLAVDLFHARYRFADRQVKEQHVMHHYGPKRVTSEGRIIVATQVIEQSLDLDMDWMISQICPIDMLFQRIGRLHRAHSTRPPGFESPLCTVLSIEKDDYSTHQLIYQNPRLLWRTEQVLANLAENLIHFPAAYRDLIDQVYQKEIWENEPEDVYGGYLAYRDEEDERRNKAKQLVSMTMKQFRDEDSTVTALTRDGETGLSILPLLSLANGGITLEGVELNALDDWERRECLDMSTVTVPRSWKRRLKDLSCDEEGRLRLKFTQADNGGWQAETADARFTYSKEYGMEKEA